MKKIVVTGSSGFIGFHVSKKFLNEGYDVFGIDIENNYYDKRLKIARRKVLQKDFNSFTFLKEDISNESITNVLQEIDPDTIVHLAAQAGVRHSIDFPHEYTKNNIDAFINILEYSKDSNLKHLVFASTSSVYGSNQKMPCRESHGVDHPLQYYAVTKRTNELSAHAYSDIYGIPVTGLRFFTVYGPWGRPDMALFKFTKNIYEGKPIDVYNFGKHKRDFTYVEDIAEGVYLASNNNDFELSKGKLNPSISNSKFRIFNIGRGKPELLIDFIKEIEINLNKKAAMNMLPMQIGDVENSHASIAKIKKLGYKPQTSIKEGVKNFVDWYKDFYDIV